MAIATVLDFNVSFDLTNTPANFSIQDVTPYSGQSIAPADVRGNFRITDPLGNIIHNNTNFATPDIAGGSSLTYNGVDIPTDVNDALIEGVYAFDYNILIDNPIIAVSTGSKTFTILGNYAALINTAGSITVVRSTGNNNTYTVVSAVFGGINTVITVTEVISNSTADGSIQYNTQIVYTKNKTVTYSDVIAKIKIEVEVDCFGGRLTSTDATSYGSTATILSRTHTVVYPPALNISDLVSSNAVVLVTPIYTKTWTTIVTTNVSYNLGGGNTIIAISTGSKETLVDCDLSLCEISCGVTALNNRYLNNRISNPPQAELYYNALTRIFQLIGMFRMYSECSQNSKAAETLTEIRTVGEFTSDCGCDDSDEPKQIVPLNGSGSGTSVTISYGTGITVTASLNGSVVNYAVALSSSYITMLNSLAPVNVLGSTYVDVTKTTPGGVDTYTITNLAPFIPLNTQQAKCLIQFSNFAAPTVSVTTSNIVREGSNMADMTVASVGSVGVGIWKFQANLFRVSSFQTSANSTYKPFISFAQLETQTLTGAVTTQANQYLQAQPIDVRILNIGSGTFDFQFVDRATSNPITNYNMVYSYKILVNIEIKQ